ncbi:hypothetical protein L6452_20851 [Arctium lappa]|uniref:Uncharacterized protein n=1 Tax=Arctium lappa TaxID=4217 RepID=A0ACB9BCK6_ARCLA|nr:hypothetical protein L6452_20851 [Arctium lappa]
MEKFADQNADPLELKLMLQVEVEPTTRYVMSEEDKYYERKIQELINEKIESFSRQDRLSNQEIVAKKSKKRPHSSSTFDQDENEKKQKTKKIKIDQNNKAIERLKKFITEEMKGSDLKLVIQKILYATDLAKNQNRLSMPINQLETLEFLTADEKRLLDTKEGVIDVPLLGPRLRMHAKPMKLTKWRLKTTCNYVLRTNWHQFVENNSEDLTVNTKIQMWSFRKDERLCFALACVGRADVN